MELRSRRWLTEGESTNMKDELLYEDLMTFPLEQVGGKFSFLHRLCRENAWPLAFGRKAIHEYKRFLYLASVSPVPVTPSEEVDQVWHLHLVYTRSYWQDLCGGVLGRQLHHGPTTGGSEEDDKFVKWYDCTKTFYRSEFNEAPPTELWPPASHRFRQEARLRWMDTSRHWIIPKPNWLKLAPYGFAGSLLLPLLPILAFAVIAIIVSLVVSQTKSKRKAEGGGVDSGDCSIDGGHSGSADCGDSGSGGDCGGGCSSGCGGGGCGGH